jgi:hypothetical protein
MLDVVDQGVEVRAGIRAEADHEVVERPEGNRASVGGAATVEPNVEADLLQLSGERLVLSSMQAVLERRGFETYDRGLVLRKRFFPNPRGPVLGRLDFEVTPSAREGPLQAGGQWPGARRHRVGQPQKVDHNALRAGQLWASRYLS